MGKTSVGNMILLHKVNKLMYYLDTFVGQGYGCFKSSLYAPNTGESAGVIAASNGFDADGDSMGLAVILVNSSEHGIWQYYRFVTNIITYH